MKNIRLWFTVSVLIAMLGTAVFAKTHSTDIIPPDTIEGTLEKEEKLIAELIIEEDGILTLSLTELTSTSKVTPRLSVSVTDGKEEVASFVTENPYHEDNSLDKEKFILVQGLAEGEYKIVAQNLREFADVSFKLETSFVEEENIETFANKSFDKATPMVLREKYYGSVSMEKDADYFCFDMPYDGYAFIEMYSEQVKFFRLFDENKNEIGYIDVAIDESDKVYELRTGLAKGRYYIQVTVHEDYSSPLYTLRVLANPKGEFNFEKEYNNRNEFADEIGFRKEYQGNLFGIEDEDVYKFTLPESCGVTIDFTDTRISDKGHYSIWLTDGKQVIYSSDDCGRDAVSLKLSKGTYYFSVSSLGEYRFSGMAYKLKVTPDKFFSENSENEDAGFGEFGDESLYQFDDVKDSDWYAGDILEARKEGLIQGTDANKYSPKSSVTVAELITMACRVHSSKNSSQVSFGLSEGKWYDVYVDYAIKTGIIKEGDFPDFTKTATRAETAYIFSNLLNESPDVSGITIPDVSSDAKYGENIYKLYSLGILKGNDSDGTFNPERGLTRAEAAVILLRVHRFPSKDKTGPVYELPVEKPEIATE